MQVQLLVKAIDFAAKKHSGQRRKNATQDPYIGHPIEVVKILVDAGVSDVTTLAAAALHDTLEDTRTTFEELVSVFGVAIATVVQECSDNKKLSKVERKRLQIKKAADVSNEAKLVKIADKLSNLSGLKSDPPKDWTPKYIKGYAYWSKCVIENMDATEGDEVPWDGNGFIIFNRLRLAVLQIVSLIIDGDASVTLESFLEDCK